MPHIALARCAMCDLTPMSYGPYVTMSVAFPSDRRSADVKHLQQGHLPNHGNAIVLKDGVDGDQRAVQGSGLRH